MSHGPSTRLLLERLLGGGHPPIVENSNEPLRSPMEILLDRFRQFRDRNEPRTLPATVVSGVESRARRIQAEDQKIRSADLAHGVDSRIAWRVPTMEQARRSAQSELEGSRAIREAERRDSERIRKEIDDTNERVLRSLNLTMGNAAKVHRVPDIMRVWYPGPFFGERASGMAMGTNVLIPRGVDTHPETMAHEYGHVFDWVNGDEGLLRSLADSRKKYLNMAGSEGTYEAHRGEYVSSVFGSTGIVLSNTSRMDSATARQHVEDVDRSLPGVKQTYDWLLNQPAFSWHPWAQLRTLPPVTVTRNRR